MRLLRKNIILTALLLSAAGCGKKDEPALTVALSAPDRGELADVGAAALRAAELAVGQINAAGGIPVPGGRAGVRLAATLREDSVENAMASVSRALSKERAGALIGGYLSGNAIPMAGMAESCGLFFVSPGATNPKFTRGRRCVFRTPFTDDRQGRALAIFALDKLKARSAAFVYDGTDEYCSDLAGHIRESFDKNGGKTLLFSPWIKGPGGDGVSKLRQAAVSGADVIFLPNYHNVIPRQIAELRAAGYSGPVVGGDSWEMLDKKHLAGITNCFFATTWNPLSPDKKSREFTEAFKKAYRRDPNPTEALTYDTFMLVFEAAGRTGGDFSPAAMAGAFRKIKRFNGVTGDFIYTGSGDPERGVVIMGIKDGGLSFFCGIPPFSEGGGL